MDAAAECLDRDLVEFVGDVFRSLTRAGYQDRVSLYLRGVMLDGRRKSIQPMARRLLEPNEQSLTHFVSNSPWDTGPVLRRLAETMTEAVGPAAWAIDDTGFLKCGRWSPAVAAQYTGSAGKVTNAQVAVSVNMVTDSASCPVNWRLFVPERWDPSSERAADDVDALRRRAGVPAAAGHREKWRLALDMIDEMAQWGLRPALVVADAGYGDAAEFRQGLAERNLSYVVGVASTVGVFPADAQRTAPRRHAAGRPPTQRYRDPASSVKDLVVAAGRKSARTVTWRDGSRVRDGRPVKMRSTFVFLRVRPAGRVLLSAYQGKDLPEAWLIAQWPPGEPAPVQFWLSNLPADTPYRTLVRWTKLRWRIEHDYRELKVGLGLDHYEGRKWAGWHHHVALVSAAHGFCTLQRLQDPKAPAPQ